MKQNDKQLHEKLWASAQQLRANSSLKLNEISEPILGLIFLKFADVRFRKAKIDLDAEKSSMLRDSASRRFRDLSPDDFKAKGILYVPNDWQVPGNSLALGVGLRISSSDKTSAEP